MKGLNDENDGEDLGEDEKKKVAEIVSQNQYWYFCKMVNIKTLINGKI